MYRVYVRNWWRMEGGRKVPNSGDRGRTLARNVRTEEEARAICRDYNSTHNPGPLSRKAEYTEQ